MNQGSKRIFSFPRSLVKYESQLNPSVGSCIVRQRGRQPVSLQGLKTFSWAAIFWLEITAFLKAASGKENRKGEVRVCISLLVQKSTCSRWCWNIGDISCLLCWGEVWPKNKRGKKAFCGYAHLLQVLESRWDMWRRGLLALGWGGHHCEGAVPDCIRGSGHRPSTQSGWRRRQAVFIHRPVFNPFSAPTVSVIAFLFFSSTCSQTMWWQEFLIQFQNDPEIVWGLGSPREAKRRDCLSSGEFPGIDLS